MDLSKMTRQEIEALLRLLTEFEREELKLLMQERRGAEREVRLVGLQDNYSVRMMGLPY